MHFIIVFDATPKPIYATGKVGDRFLRGQLKALAEQEEKLARCRAEGGYTSQVGGTIRNVKGLIKAATDWLFKNP